MPTADLREFYVCTDSRWDAEVFEKMRKGVHDDARMPFARRKVVDYCEGVAQFTGCIAFGPDMIDCSCCDVKLESRLPE